MNRYNRLNSIHSYYPTNYFNQSFVLHIKNNTRGIFYSLKSFGAYLAANQSQQTFVEKKEDLMNCSFGNI